MTALPDQTSADSTYIQAEHLVNTGRVLEVRVLQAGSIVTGIVGADPQGGNTDKYRIYIRRPNAADMAGECSCGKRSPCVHVLAVSIAAARSAREAAAGPPAGSMHAPHRLATSSMRAAREPSQQRLHYMLSQTSAGLEVSALVGQEGDAGSACVFTPRSSQGTGEFPRYVDAQDKRVLQALMAQRTDGPWLLYGATGAALLQEAAATGRAFWHSLSGKPLRGGEPRPASFTWQILPNGEQQLCSQARASVHMLLDLEPPMYVDTEVNEYGRLELRCPLGLLRHYWKHPAIAPEQVATCNEQIAREARGTDFPQLRTLAVQEQPLSSLAARLILCADAEARLYFMYNGMAIDSSRLRPAQAKVRQLVAGDVLHEIARDLATEQRLQAQLDQALDAATGWGSGFGLDGSAGLKPGPQGRGLPTNREGWLAFVMHAVPRLQAEGWEVQIDARFPHRIVAAGSWYADMETAVREPSSGPDRPPSPAKGRRKWERLEGRGGELPSSGPDGRDDSWFSLRLGVVVEGESVNLLPVLARYLQTSYADDASITLDLAVDDAPCCRVGDQWLVRLDDGRYLPIPIERIRRIADTLVELFDRGSLDERQTLALPRSQAVRLAQLHGEMDGALLRSNDASLRTLIDGLKDFSGIQPLSGPADFRATLRHYQEEGLGWLQFLRRHRLGGILADDMGLGKTVQTLAHLVLEKEQGRLRKPSLIVAPVSALGNWQQEIRRFAPGLKLVTLHGSRRKESFHLIERADLVLTGYALLQLDSDTLLARDFYLVILDEAQMIKNPRSKVSQVARALRAEHRLCLTGTPVENHLGELWSLFEFLQPGFLGTEQRFQRHYRTPIERNGDKRRAQALTARIAPFLLRRTKDAVAQELPPKTQIVETIVLEEEQRDFYDGIRLAMHSRIQDLVQQQGLARSQITILDALLKLRQACCDPRLLDLDASSTRIPSAKLDWLQAVLPELVAEGRRILLFSQFTSMLRLIEATVAELSIPYCLLTGQTQHRGAVVERFQSGEVPLFLISLKAGGTALNLTAADTVIHYDPWWNPAAEAQATDRAHRIGQTRPVFVYKLIAQATVEERMLRLQEDKRALASQLYTGTSASPTSLSAADLEILLAP